MLDHANDDVEVCLLTSMHDVSLFCVVMTMAMVRDVCSFMMTMQTMYDVCFCFVIMMIYDVCCNNDDVWCMCS